MLPILRRSSLNRIGRHRASQLRGCSTCPRSSPMILLGAEIANILVFHIAMAPADLAPVVVAVLLWLIVVYDVSAALRLCLRRVPHNLFERRLRLASGIDELAPICVISQLSEDTASGYCVPLHGNQSCGYGVTQVGFREPSQRRRSLLN